MIRTLNNISVDNKMHQQFKLLIILALIFEIGKTKENVILNVKYQSQSEVVKVPLFYHLHLIGTYGIKVSINEN